jgi:beta-galactosidase
MVDVDADFTKYRVVLAPALALLDEKTAAKLEAFAAAGGTLIATPQSGTRTTDNHMSEKTRPGLLAGLAGVTVEEVRPYYHGQTNEIAFTTGRLASQTCSVGTWVEVLQCASAQAVAEFRDEAFAGKPAITCNAVGQGKVYYLGVYPPTAALKEFLGDLLPDVPVKDIPEGVEVVQRVGNQTRLVFLINNTRERQSVSLPGQYRDILSGEVVGPKVIIAGNGVLVLKV